MNKSFCFFFQKEALSFFFEKKNQKTFISFVSPTAADHACVVRLSVARAMTSSSEGGLEG